MSGVRVTPSSPAWLVSQPPAQPVCWQSVGPEMGTCRNFCPWSSPNLGSRASLKMVQGHRGVLHWRAPSRWTPLPGPIYSAYFKTSYLYDYKSSRAVKLFRTRTIISTFTVITGAHSPFPHVRKASSLGVEGGRWWDIVFVLLCWCLKPLGFTRCPFLCYWIPMFSHSHSIDTCTLLLWFCFVKKQVSTESFQQSLSPFLRFSFLLSSFRW